MSCEMKAICKFRQKDNKIVESVEVAVGNILMDARVQRRCESWLRRSEIYVKSYAVGFSASMRFKRAIKFGQLRRGLVLRKRMEEQKR